MQNPVCDAFKHRRRMNNMAFLAAIPQPLPQPGLELQPLRATYSQNYAVNDNPMYALAIIQPQNDRFIDRRRRQFYSSNLADAVAQLILAPLRFI